MERKMSIIEDTCSKRSNIMLEAIKEEINL